MARAAQAKGQLQIMSTQSSFGVEDVTKARGGPIWYQLYTTNNFAATTALVKRAQAAGCPAVAVTVDLPAGRNTVTATRLARTDARDCGTCHEMQPAIGCVRGQQAPIWASRCLPDSRRGVSD